MTTTTADNFDKNDIKNYTYKDKEYYRIYNRVLYKQKTGLDCKCDICGSVVKYCHMKRHQATNKCRKIIEPPPDISNKNKRNKEPQNDKQNDKQTKRNNFILLEKRISQLENILSRHGITEESTDYDNDEAISN